MPLFSGIATHDNTKHVGSAKAGVPGGVAQLDDGGNLSLIESEIIIPRSDIGDISFNDKLSDEKFLSFIRAGSNDWSASVLEKGSPYDLLSSYWYNRPNGIPKLSSEGRIETALLPVLLEEYTNHTGSSDNFMTESVQGDGLTEERVSEHARAITSGTSQGSRGGVLLGTGFNISYYENLFQVQIVNYNDITSNNRMLEIGFSADPSNFITTSYAVFRYTPQDSWGVFISDKNMDFSWQTVQVEKGDIVAVKIIKGQAIFLVNGIEVFRTQSNALAGPMIPFATSRATFTESGNELTMILDGFIVKRYRVG